MYFVVNSSSFVRKETVIGVSSSTSLVEKNDCTFCLYSENNLENDWTSFWHVSTFFSMFFDFCSNKSWFWQEFFVFSINSVRESNRTWFSWMIFENLSEIKIRTLRFCTFCKSLLMLFDRFKEISSNFFFKLIKSSLVMNKLWSIFPPKIFSTKFLASKIFLRIASLLTRNSFLSTKKSLFSLQES